MHPNNPYHEGELSAQLKQKDHYAFKQLYNKHAPALYSVILQIVSDQETANKVLVEVFHTIRHNIESFDPSKERLFTWMLNIARQVSVKETIPFYQQGSNQAPLTKEEILQSITYPETDNYGLKKVIHRLNEEQKMLIHLRYFKNFTNDQIAKILDMPSETVRVRTRIALSELRTLLQ